MNADDISREELLNGPGEAYSVTLSTAGTYGYYCEPHQGGWGRGWSGVVGCDGGAGQGSQGGRAHACAAVAEQVVVSARGVRWRSQAWCARHKCDLGTTFSRWCVTMTLSTPDSVNVTHHLETVVSRSRSCHSTSTRDRRLQPPHTDHDLLCH